MSESKERRRIVIIGGVACGPKVAARARRLDTNAEITIVEQGNALSYAGCGMPYYIKGAVPEMRDLMSTPVGTPRNAAYFRSVKDVNVLTQTRAISIDRQNKVVHAVNLETGERYELPYDKLVLATGGYSVWPPIPGVRLDYVFGLREPRNASAIRDALSSGHIKRAVIVGGGLIGLEMSEALIEQGVQVAMVEMMPHILPGLLDMEMATFLTRHMTAKGVEIYTGEKVVRLEGDLSAVSRVVTEKRELPADMVLIAVGVRPRSELAREAGLEIGPRGGILVNEHLQTSDPDIYAGGDCVENHHLLTGEWAYVPLGSTANKHGRVIGTNVVGGNATFPGIVGTAIVKVFEYNVGRTGLTEKDARQRGHNVVISITPAPDKAHYYPTAKTIMVKLIADADTRKLLGAQVVGPGEVAKRVDVAATALRFGATVDDVATLDLAYAPPYSEALDNIIHAASVIQNKLDGIAESVSPQEVKAKMERGEDFILLDVRSPAEYEALRIEDTRVRLIPLGQLRASMDDLPRDKEIITFCAIGLRGYEAYRTLKGAGFTCMRFFVCGLSYWPLAIFVILA
ncbi:MAG: FAD-dependent oxidoreductase, partial [Anaerolineae bacterium]|nr:FAD-dependent oxidoreductase [Anaerolineae bacterium]